MDSRKEFEIWACRMDRDWNMICDLRGDYISAVTSGAWESWQARRKPIGYVVPRMLKAMQAGKYCGISISDEKKDGDIAVYTHPASDVPDAEYIRALQDAFDIIQADANTEQNYWFLCRIGRVLAKLKAKQEQGQ